MPYHLSLFPQSVINALQRRGLEEAAEAIFPMLDAPSQDLNIPYLTQLFEDSTNIDCLLAGSSLFKNAGTVTQIPAETPELRQLAAKVHKPSFALTTATTD